MKRETLKTILKENLGYSDVSVRKILCGDRKPSYENMLKLNKKHRIPFVAWENINSYLQNNDTVQYPNKSIPKTA